MPGLIEQLRAEAPARIEAVKNADTKAVQEKAKVAQEAVTAKFTEVLGAIDPKKLGETAQDLALRGVGVAAEYAVRAKETYDKVAEHGEQAVRSWRGEVAEEIVDIAAAVEPEASEPQAATEGEPPRSRRRGVHRSRGEARREEDHRAPRHVRHGQEGRRHVRRRELIDAPRTGHPSGARFVVVWERDSGGSVESGVPEVRRRSGRC